MATSMRAFNIADLHVTKYQSKPQEVLAPTMQPLAAGMRRQEEEEAVPEVANLKVIEQARQ